MNRYCLSAAVAGLLAAAPAHAGGPLWIDHPVTYDDSGIWAKHNQHILVRGSALGVVAGAMFIDSDSRLGRTFDQALDSMLFTAVTVTAAKRVFSRERPIQDAQENSTNRPDPGDFFEGAGHQSFPSGDVAQVAAVVTPFIAEYHDDQPWVWSLALLPAYDAVARVKVRAHWQSDVLVGAAIGVGFGLYAHRREQPWVVTTLPGGGWLFGYHRTF